MSGFDRTSIEVTNLLTWDFLTVPKIIMHGLMNVASWSLSYILDNNERT